MESAMTAVTVVAGVFFSLSCALLIEELVLGGLFRLFFAPRPERPGVETNLGRKN